MTPQKLIEFKSMFEQERRKILASQAKAMEDLKVPEDDLLDEIDLTTSELEQAMRIRLRNRQALYLKKIDQALLRIHEGSFGECQGCGDLIEIKRLEARPTTTHCLGCKEEQERREHMHVDGRKHKSLGAKLRLRLA